MKSCKIALIAILAGLLAVGQQPPAAPPPVKKPAAAAPASPVDNVIKLLKAKMSEALILRSLQTQKPYNLSPAEMARLKDAGASDNIIMAIMDPASAAAPAAGPVPPPPPPPPPVVVEAPAAVQSCPAPAAVSALPNAGKRRIAVDAFDYSAVRTAVTGMAGGNDVNIGEGIRSMLQVKMAQSKTVVLLERKKIQQTMREQDFDKTNRVKQGTGAKIGQITGADALLYGDIVTFGRDDKAKKNGAGGVLRYIPKIGGIAGGIADSRETDKAVVVINLRIVDAETSEVIDSEQARGESTRTSTNWATVAGAWGGGAGASSDMTSKNFGETIIGEATQDAVNKIAAILEKQVPAIAAKTRVIEGRVSSIDGCTVILAVGGNDGIQVGDRFEILKITGTYIDPVTKEVLDVQTEKAGDMIVSTVRDKIVIGQYGGAPISMTYSKGYTARKAQ